MTIVKDKDFKFYTELDNTLQEDYGIRLEYLGNDLDTVISWLLANNEVDDVEDLIDFIKRNR
jgi:hypothetical protein